MLEIVHNPKQTLQIYTLHSFKKRIYCVNVRLKSGIVLRRSQLNSRISINVVRDSEPYRENKVS